MFFGCLEGRVVGAGVCVWSFSTFTGRSSVNQHDFSVLPEVQGAGSGLRSSGGFRGGPGAGAAKMTLGVHGTNEAAKRLYARFGFEGWSSPTLFVCERSAGASRGWEPARQRAHRAV